jgi:hypothetical protein
VHAGAQPYLGARTGQRSGDKMIDGVSPGARPLALLGSSTPGVWRQGLGQELAAAHLLLCGRGTHDTVRLCSRKQGGALGGGQGVLAERDQGVAHPTGKLARYRQGRPVAALAGLDLLVELIVG